MLDRVRPFMRSKIEVDDNGCWRWLGRKTTSGYATVWIDDERYQAHRVVYEDLRGPIPPGLVCDHLCRVRDCVNPDHIEPVTNAENIRRGVTAQVLRERAAKITECPQGHPYTPENTYVAQRTGGGEYRQCRTCNNRRRNERRLRARAAQ